MAIECTDPGRWGNVPGFDADEGTVERYLGHLEECEYHARLENQADEHLAAAAGMARAHVRSNAIVLPGRVANRIHEQRAARLDELRTASIRELSIRVDGVEMARATAERSSSTEVRAAEGAVVSVWSIGTESDAFLSSCIVAGKRQEESTTLLAGGQTIAFRVDSRSGAPARVSVAFAPLVVSEARPATRAGVLERLSAVMAAGGRWAPVYGLVAAALTVAVVAPIYFMQHDAYRSATDQVATVPNTESKLEGPDPKQSPADGSLPSVNIPSAPVESIPAASNEPKNTTRPKRRDAPRTRQRHDPPPPTVTTLAAVRRIYISSGEATTELRDAIATELQATGKYEVVTSRRKADATLKLSQTRNIGSSIAVSLDSRMGVNLFDGSNLVVAGEDGPAKAAASFVKELLESSQKSAGKTPSPTEPDQ